MTGFGQADENGYHIEVKGVNHRYRDIRIRVPRDLSALEIPARDLVNEYVARGKVEITISRMASSDVQDRLSINWDLARAYFSDLKKMASDFGGEASFRDVLALPGVMAEGIPNAEDQWAVLKSVIVKSMESFQKTKKDEGKRLVDDMVLRLDSLAAMQERMEEAAKGMTELYRDRLTSRLNELMSDVKAEMIDDARIHQEAAIIADRSDITEEFVRLNSHIASFKGVVADPDPSIGRRLDFILQEINRELNTIGSKSQLTALSHIVIEAKSEVEKIREQVQNIE